MGATQPLEPVYRDADGNVLAGVTGASWSSSSPAIASVDLLGRVTGVSLGGPVTITVAKDGHSASTALSVIPDRISFSPFITTLEVNHTQQLTATPMDYTGQPIAGVAGQVTWSSGSPSVATVDPVSGMVTAIAPGTVRIFATVAGRTSQLEIEVGVVSVYDGAWSGASVAASFSYPVQFTVLFGRIMQYRWTISAPAGCTVGSVVIVTPNAPITNGQFSFTASSSIGSAFTVSGQFPTASTMTGANSTLNLGACPTANGGITNPTLPAGTISATRQ